MGGDIKRLDAHGSQPFPSGMPTESLVGGLKLVAWCSSVLAVDLSSAS